MKSKIVLIFVILTFNTLVYAKHKIVTSVTPIASIVAMLLGTNAEINSIASSNMCPHHYQAKPSDLNMVKHADINIYIDDKFDIFAAKLMNNSDAKLIKISNFRKLKFIKNNNSVNWHFWLDLDNTFILLKEFSLIFVKEFPELKRYIEYNLEQSLQQLNELALIKNRHFSKYSHLILLSDSLEYFFSSYKQLDKLYEPSIKSLKFLNLLNVTLSKNFRKTCLILSSEQDLEFYKKFNTPLVQVESENWQMTNDLSHLYYIKYLEMLQLLTSCEY